MGKRRKIFIGVIPLEVRLNTFMTLYHLRREMLSSIKTRSILKGPVLERIDSKTLINDDYSYNALK